MIKEDIVADMRSGPFSIATDGSNDAKDKQFSIFVTTISKDGLKTRLLCVPVLSDAATGICRIHINQSICYKTTYDLFLLIVKSLLNFFYKNSSYLKRERNN